MRQLKEVDSMTLKQTRCARCGHPILALRLENQPLCQDCRPKKKQGLLALLLSLLLQ
jgi:RNA polymerase-binding transcription factor DksA